jgi:SAM-dependent methyltransferase
MSNQDQASKYYSKGHNGYYAKNFIGRDGRLSNIKDWVQQNTPKGGKVLDIGCGDMTLSVLAPELDWVGIDIDDKKDPRIVKQDITSTPYSFNGGTFDTAVCSEVLEHLFTPEDVIKEARRVLKPGGTFIVTVPNYDNLDNLLSHHRGMLYDPEQFWTIEHIRLYNHVNMTKLLQDHGFKVVKQVGQSTGFSQILVGACQNMQAELQALGVTLDQAQTDQILGRILPYNCPGLGFLCKKV